MNESGGQLEERQERTAAAEPVLEIVEIELSEDKLLNPESGAGGRAALIQRCHVIARADADREAKEPWNCEY